MREGSLKAAVARTPSMFEDGVLAVDYTASETGSAFLADDSFVRGIMGPVGSGKSTICCMEILRRACESPVCLDGVRRSRAVVIRNTYPELRDTTMKTFGDWIPPDVGHWKLTDKTFIIDFVSEDDGVPVYCEVLFRALDTPDDVRSLLSLELTFAYINEAREVEKAVLRLLLTRLRRYPATRMLPPGATYWSGLWMDTNPCDDDHWWYKRFEEEKPKGSRLFRQPGGRHPKAENLANLPANYYADIIEQNKDDPDFIKVYVDGEYGAPKEGKPIYPEWKDSVHVDASVEPDPSLDILLGQDFGLTPAIVLAQRKSDGQLQVFDEFVSEDMGARRFGDELLRYIKKTYPGRALRGWGDPAGSIRAQTDETTPFDIMNAAGIPVAPAPTNDFDLRREAVAGMLQRMTMLSRPALVVHPRCKTLRKGMGGRYCYRRLRVTGREAFALEPDKNKYSHVCEGLQYLAVGEGEDSVPVTPAAAGNEADRGRRVQLRFKVKRSIGR